MKILVTGAQGFIARALVETITEHDVYALCRRDSQFTRSDITVVSCDLATVDDLSLLPAQMDCVVHLAQSSRFRDWPAADAATDIFAVNVLATQKLLDYAKRAGATQFLLASTGSVYTPSPEPQSELAPIMPSGYYAATKFAAEILLRPYDNFFATCALRLFYPYGPGQTNRLVSDLIERVESGRAISLRGNSDGLLFNPTYLDDVMSVIRKALNAQWRGVVNVATPEIISLRDAGRVIGAALDREPIFEVLEGASPKPVLPTLDELRARHPDLRCRSFVEGVRATLANRRQ